MNTLSVVHEASASRVTSDPVIPAVPGKFYSYNADFSIERPLCYLMDCKANKSRPLAEADHIGLELDLTFVFENGVWVCSPDSAPSFRLIGDLVDPEALNRTSIALAGISDDAFDWTHRRKDMLSLVNAYPDTTERDDSILRLSSGLIVAVRTESGKHGLFRVQELTPTSVKVDACHILL